MNYNICICVSIFNILNIYKNVYVYNELIKFNYSNNRLSKKLIYKLGYLTFLYSRLCILERLYIKKGNY